MSKQAFMQNLLKGSKFKVINGNGMRKLDNGNVVKCTINTNQCSGHYQKLVVTIINQTDGQLDRTAFQFDELLEHAKNDHPNANTRDSLQVIEHCGWNWYINKPTQSSIKSMIDVIEEHISFFE